MRGALGRGGAGVGWADIPPETVLGFPAADIFCKQGAAALQAPPAEQIAASLRRVFRERDRVIIRRDCQFPFFKPTPPSPYLHPQPPTPNAVPFDKKLLEKTAYLLFFFLFNLCEILT